MSENDTEQETAASRYKRRIDQIAAGDKRYNTRLLTDSEKSIVLDMLEQGATFMRIIERGVIPSHGAILMTRKHDAEFDSKCVAAINAGIVALLETATDQATDAATSGDPDKARIADSLMKVVQVYAEKRAPREYGALVKVAGHDGGALTVTVQDYSKVLNGGKLQEIEVTADCEVQTEDRARESSALNLTATSAAHGVGVAHDASRSAE